METQYIVWISIALCLTQSGMFSGLNLALLGLGRMRLEAEAAAGNTDAVRILDVRKDANLLLTTVLWGNVAVNCLLTILSDSIMSGVAAFLFSTIGITIFGEIFPQAYFSRNAMRVGALLTPAIRFYQLLLYPIVKPSALLLDWFLGNEEITYLRERDIREVLKLHANAPESDIDRVEAAGALNFLALDDMPVSLEGQQVHPASVMQLAFEGDRPSIPSFTAAADDPFLGRIQASGRKWVIVTNAAQEPKLVLDADGFLRAAIFGEGPADFPAHCHQPIVVRDPGERLGTVMRRFRVQPEGPEDDVIDFDLILFWTAGERRIITGSDLLGRLLRGIAVREGGDGPEHAAPRAR